MSSNLRLDQSDQEMRIPGVPVGCQRNVRLKAKTLVKLFLDVLMGKEKLDLFRFTLAEMAAEAIYPKYKFSEHGRIFLEDSEFIRLYESLAPRIDYHSLDRWYVLDQLLKLVIAVPGDTAECGAYQGASSYLICRRIAQTGKKHHVFDSFEGLPAPGAMDGTHWSSGAFKWPEDAVRWTLREFPFARTYKGWIPERFQDVADVKFCFLHIDVDIYQPTLDSLRFFYGRMSPGALLLFDEYGYTTAPGERRAVDEFFSDKLEEPILLPTGQAFVVIGPTNLRK